jgi:DNA helicase-2/ATP-dependent DNA helicase PcrA
VPDILKALDDQQRAAAECVSGPVAIFAGAGTGKTRTITHRIAHAVASGVHDPSQTLAVTFTTRAAGELRNRLGQLGVSGVQVRTFHSAALRQLRFFYPQFFNSSLPDLMPSKFRFVADAATLCRVANDKDSIRDLAAEIEWAKVNILSPDAYREKAVEVRRDLSGDLTIEKVSKVFEAYLTRLDEAHAMDFEDVLLLTTAMMENYPEMASAVRKQYRHFTVDEFQDVSPVQFELLNLWLGDRDDVCVVGDPAQTIYSFSGATSKYLIDFKSHFARTQRGKGPGVNLNAYANDEEEAQKIGKQILDLIAKGNAPRDIAVLYRINSQSEIFEAELSALGVPISLRGAERFFERAEVKNALLNLRAGLHVTGTKAMAETVRDILSSVGWKAQAPDSGRAARETWESLNTIVDLADELQAKDATAQLPDFVKSLDLRSEMEFAPSANAVTLASIHAAKGLEWEAVFIAGVSEGLLPISHATTAAEFNEERRLLYVAMTRAKTHLSISWAKSRHTDGKGYREQSTLLRDLKF